MATKTMDAERRALLAAVRTMRLSLEADVAAREEFRRAAAERQLAQRADVREDADDGGCDV